MIFRNMLIFRFFRNTLLHIFLSGSVGLYYLSLDVWGDTWSIFKNHESLHKKIFIILISISLFTLFIKGIDDWINKSKDKQNPFLFENFLLHNKVLEIILPAFISSYYLSIDVWGDRLSIFRDYESIHSKVFFVLILISLAILLLRGISETYNQKAKNKYIILTEELINFFTKNIDNQLIYSRAFSRIVRSKKRVAHSKEDIDLIINNTINDLLNLIKNIFESESISITIISKNYNNDEFYYEFSNEKFLEKTKSEIILNKNSTASFCLMIGESCLIIDKQAAAKEKRYYLSDRDKKNNLIGSNMG